MPAQPGSRGDYSHIPIPSYEEAIGSRPSSSQTFLGPSEISNDAEREGLLGQAQSNAGPSTSAGTRRGYRAPTVESARSSLDDLDNLVVDDEGHGSGRESMEELRREMSEMEFEDAPSRNKWSTRLSSGLSSLNLNIQFTLPQLVRPYIPTWSGFRASLPSTEFLRNVRLDFTIIIRVFAFVFVIFTGYLVFFSDVLKSRHRMAHTYDPEQVRGYIMDHVREDRIRSDLYYITSYDHMAGTEGSWVLGQWIYNHWDAMKIGPVDREHFEVLLNYPREGGRKVFISEPEDKRWQATIEEPAVYNEKRPTQQTAVFHGLSASGNATGHLIYANHGSKADWEQLKRFGVKVEGSIALIRDGGPEPDAASKINTAASFGAVGVLTYSDPADQDKEMTAFNGNWRADGAVQRSSVSDSGLILGDVLSPGYASAVDLETRLDITEARELGYIPRIPSLPLAWHEDASRLLTSLQGVGKNLEIEAPSFVGAIPYAQWWSGDESSPKVSIENNADDVIRQPIYNIFSRIEGVEQSAAKVVVGNHRDAWCFGAVDPGSGTAIMMEVSRVFAELMARSDWRPARTIEFASWDGGEANMLGSTEHVEANLDELRKNGVAYVNIDAAVFGPTFHARASPTMQRVLYRVMDRLGPDTAAGMTLRKLWEQNNSDFEALGSDGDYAAFQNIAGVPSIDMGFTGSSYPKGSCYDTFELLEGIFDQSFTYHKLMAQVVALLILELADAPAVPLDLEAYANGIGAWLSDLSKFASSKSGMDLDFKPLNDAVQLMKDNTKQHRKFEESWDSMIHGGGGFEAAPIAAQRIQHNTRTMQFEKDLLDLSEGGGLPGRTQFKHVVSAPDRLHSSNDIYFPALREAVEAGDREAAQEQVQKIAGIIGTASTNLVLHLN